MFSSKSSVFLALTFSSLIHFELIFCIWYEIGIKLHSFACRYPVVSAPFVEKTICFLIELAFGPPCQASVDPKCELRCFGRGITPNLQSSDLFIVRKLLKSNENKENFPITFYEAR